MELSQRARIRAGDRASFGAVFDEHASAVHRYAVRVTGDWAGAEDVVSVTFLEAWRLRGRLRPDGGSVLPWLYGIATNVLRNRARSARRHTAAGTPDPAHHRAAPTSTGVPGLTGDETAPQLLGKVALASAAGHTVPARADQYVYVRSTVAFASYPEGGGGKAKVDRPHQRQVWLSVDGTHPGRLTERGENTTLDPVPTPTVHMPTYAYLRTLPTDPDHLLALVHADYDATPSGPGRDAEAFVAIGDLLRESLVPPTLAAGLYRAAAKIPGVTVVRTATDAAGRTGVAVAMADPKAGSRTEWIFDRGTLGFLGERTVQVASGDAFPPGTVTGSSAVTDRAVVDRPGRLPR
ncbi:MAG TPA: CU044_5270 family protein [Actinocatenispora sp.]